MIDIPQGAENWPRVFLSIKFYEDHCNRDWVEGLSQKFRAEEIWMFCVAKDIELWGKSTFPPHLLMEKTFQSITQCHYLLADVTEKGMGIGIEIGYAAASQIPVIGMVRSGYEVSTTVMGVARKIITYMDEIDAVNQVTEIIRNDYVN